MDARISYYSPSFIKVIHDEVRNTERVAKMSWVFRFFKWVERLSIRNVEQLYIQLLGLNEVIIQNPDKISEKDYATISAAMNYFSRLHSFYRKIEFMESNELMKISTDTLTLGYSIEAKMKKALYDSKVRRIEGSEYIAALSEHSKNSLGSKIA